MPKLCFVIAFSLALSGTVTAQEKVTFAPPKTKPDKSGCTPYPDVPELGTWMKSTDVATRPYRVSGSREKEMRDAYSKLELAMSRPAVEKVMGKPDFQQVMAGFYGGKPTGVCIDQWVYIFRKNDTNPINPEDVAIYLSFSANGQLYWAVPQNIDLKQKGSAVQK